MGDPSGSKAKGKGVFQFSSKYGGNIDTYAPIYNPQTFGDDFVTGMSERDFAIFMAFLAPSSSPSPSPSPSRATGSSRPALTVARSCRSPGLQIGGPGQPEVHAEKSRRGGFPLGWCWIQALGTGVSGPVNCRPAGLGWAQGNLNRKLL